MTRPSTTALLVLAVLLALCLVTIDADHAAKRGSKHGKKPRKSRPSESESDEAKENTTALYTGATALSSPLRSLSQLPSQFDWCSIDGLSFCTSSWNQHIPRYCGSCYVHGALHAVNDRIKILMRGLHDVQLARQVILNCAPTHGLGDGCDGGEGFDVFEFMHRFGLPDESCQIYKAKATEQCDAAAYCHNCMPIGEEIFPYQCWPVHNPIRYYADSYGSVRGEAAMMSEIHARGPITCGFASVDDFDYNYRGGIYVDYTNATELNHDVEIVGWGEENGVKYWLARNSWGTYWGENSFFKIARGINNMQIESDCVFAILDTHMVEKVLEGKLGGSMYGLLPRTDRIFNRSKEHHPHIQHAHVDRVVASHKLAAQHSGRHYDAVPYTADTTADLDPTITADSFDPHRYIELTVLQSYENERQRGQSSSRSAIKRESDARHNDESMIAMAMTATLLRADGSVSNLKTLIQSAFTKLEDRAATDHASQADVDVVEEEIRRAWKQARKNYTDDTSDSSKHGKSKGRISSESDSKEEIDSIESALSDWLDECQSASSQAYYQTVDRQSVDTVKGGGASLTLPVFFGLVLGVGLTYVAFTLCSNARHSRDEYEAL